MRASSVKQGPEAYKWKGNNGEYEHFLTRVDSCEGGEEPRQQIPLGGGQNTMGHQLPWTLNYN